MASPYSYDIKRAGYAESFVQNFRGTTRQAFDNVMTGIKNDVAANAPRGKGEVRPGDVRLSESFYTVAAQEVSPGVLEGYMGSRVPAKARSHEYGSGIQGPQIRRYPIRPRNAKRLKFEKEGKTLILPMVMHPGVYGRYYINETLRYWRPALAQKFADSFRLAAELPKTRHPIGVWI